MDDALDALQSSLADRYRIEREIGAGGMATVYLARDLRHGRAVALKVLRPDVAAGMGVERFQREVAVTASLQHPHILSLFDSGESAGQLYYVTMYVDGESLREKLERERQLPIEQVVAITREVADALDYAHRQGIVHRDIKPANILLAAYARGQAHALVADFGIARALPTAGKASTGIPDAGTDRLTQAGLAVGTPTYMSPEQMMGDSHVDGRSDVYSLGCVVYEMLAGEPPFTGVTGEAVAARKRSPSIPSIAHVRSSVPASVDAVIARALVPVAADRYATAGEFGAALAAALATDAGAVGRSRRAAASTTGADVPRRMLRPRAITLAVVTVALVAVAGWAFATRHAPGMKPVPAGGTRDTVALALYRQAHAEIERRTEASVARAVALLQRAIARDSNYADAWADLTRALMFAQGWRFDVPGIPRARLGEYAVLAGVRALEADSMSVTSWIARATTLYIIDPTTRRGVAEALHRAIALDSGSADAWFTLGNHYQDLLDADSALTAYRRAVAIRPTHPNVLAFLALTYMWQRNPDSAITWGDSAVRSNPTHILSRQARGMVLVQQGRLAEAEADFAAVVGLGQGPERVWGWTGLAVVAARRRDRRAVDSLTAHAIADADTLRPTSHEAVYLAWKYAETGQRDRALAVLERFTRPRHLHFQLHLLREFALDSLRREPRFVALLRSDTARGRR